VNTQAVTDITVPVVSRYYLVGSPSPLRRFPVAPWAADGHYNPQIRVLDHSKTYRNQRTMDSGDLLWDTGQFRTQSFWLAPWWHFLSPGVRQTHARVALGSISRKSGCWVRGFRCCWRKNFLRRWKRGSHLALRPHPARRPARPNRSARHHHLLPASLAL